MTEEDFLRAFPLVQQLRTHLNQEQYLELIREMRPAGYRAFVLEDDHKPRCYAGVEIRTNLYHLRHLFVFDLVSDDRHRSQGFGAVMMSFLKKLAERENCSGIELTSGLQRERAHHFYERIGMKKISYAFKWEP